MAVLKAVRVVALVPAGLQAGILLGYRAGDYPALRGLSASCFVQFQQGLHLHFVKLMPPSMLAALLASLGWRPERLAGPHPLNGRLGILGPA